MSTPKLTRRGFIAVAAAALPLIGIISAGNASSTPKIAVFKDPSCGCCGAWVDHLRAAGFAVEVVETRNLDAVKTRLGVPENLAACHTAEIGGYVIEGHVPATAIRRLLDEKPGAVGLAVPGMPVGSPGMEVAGSAPDTYEVILFGKGSQQQFARFEGGREL